jgi:arylsulfatase A-like enzyme
LIAQINALGTKSRQLANRPAAQADAPNVLLIVMDTVRPQSLSLCGYERSTSPELEKLAQKGVLFPQALTACSWTLPSHATLFTGQPQNLHRADFDRALDKTYPTLAECLRDSGYSSCGVVANFGCCGLISGLSRGFDEYIHFKSLKVMYKYASFMARYIFGMTEDHEMLAPEVNDNFLAWLDKRDTNRPFFGFLNYLDAHTPYCVPDPAFDRFTDLDPALRTRFRQRWAFEGEAGGIEQRADPVEMTLAKDTYDGSIAYLSYHIGQLMDALEARGVLDNTLVVITNDHGEAFGEHGTWEHAKTMYRTEIQSFVLLFGPGVRNGVVLDIPVSHSDVARTILDLVSGKPRENLGGESFAGLCSVDDSRTGRGSPMAYSQINLIKHQLQSLVIEGFHFIHNSNGVEPDKLFDYNSDPAEQHDLAASAVGERWLPIFRQQLHSFTGETSGNPTGDSRSSPAVTQWWTEGLCFRGSHTVCRCGRAPMTRWQYDRYLKR